MSKMSKKLINKFSFFLLCFILSFYSSSQSSDNIDKFKIQNWIENIPILPILIENKRFRKKIFKIENFEDNILKIKIIVENF